MPRFTRHSRNPVWMAALVCCLLVDISGCSLFVMAGKMLQGDPMLDGEFDKYYGKSMEKSGKKVAVFCSTPESVKSEFSSLDLDLAASINRKLSVHNIDVIENHRIAGWIDDNGGDFDLKQMGSEIEADLVIKITFDHFDYREEQSADLFRGKARGNVEVFELVRAGDKGTQFESSPAKNKDKAEAEAEEKESADDSKDSKGKKSKKKKHSKAELKVQKVRKVYERSFDTTYPTLQPVSITNMQPETFRRKFVERMADELARLFYKHKPGTDI